MRRATDPAFLEAIANDPRVRPFIGGEGEMRAGDTWGRTVGLEWDEGGIVFLDEGEGTYSVHLLFLPGTPDVVGKCREAIDYLFSQTDAKRFTGTFPTHYTRVTRVAEAVGMRHQYDHDGETRYVFDRQQWAGRP